VQVFPSLHSINEVPGLVHFVHPEIQLAGAQIPSPPHLSVVQGLPSPQLASTVHRLHPAFAKKKQVLFPHALSVQGLLSSQSNGVVQVLIPHSVFWVNTQAPFEQVSLVQLFPSLQTIGAYTHAPPTHWSVVQVLPSLQTTVV